MTKIEFTHVNPTKEYWVVKDSGGIIRLGKEWTFETEMEALSKLHCEIAMQSDWYQASSLLRELLTKELVKIKKVKVATVEV